MTARKIARELIASTVACLFLLQALAFIFSSNGRIAFASGDAGAAIAMAGEICHGPLDGGKAPAPHGHQHHCTLCSLSHQDHAAAIVAKVILALAPRSNDAPARFVRDRQAPPPLGWTSSWSSRAPPFFS